jgi:probable rRNA maturation factor
MITIEPTAGLESKLSRSGLTSFLNRARLAVGLSGEVEVLLADDSTLRRLNKTFLGKDKPTDVLSFPTPAEISQVHAGDLAISLETAARQAATYGHSLRDEVKILLLHGLLHLSGLDHETDNGEMASREATVRRELRLPHTLIERTLTVPKKTSSRPTKKPSIRPAKETSSRPKAAPFAATVERSLYSAPTSSIAKRKKPSTKKRGAK